MKELKDPARMRIYIFSSSTTCILTTGYIHIIIGLKEHPPCLVWSKITQLCEINDWINQVRNRVFCWLIQGRIRGRNRSWCLRTGDDHRYWGRSRSKCVRPRGTYRSWFQFFDVLPKCIILLLNHNSLLLKYQVQGQQFYGCRQYKVNQEVQKTVMLHAGVTS